MPAGLQLYRCEQKAQQKALQDPAVGETSPIGSGIGKIGEIGEVLNGEAHWSRVVCTKLSAT